MKRPLSDCFLKWKTRPKEKKKKKSASCPRFWEFQCYCLGSQENVGNPCHSGKAPTSEQFPGATEDAWSMQSCQELRCFPARCWWGRGDRNVFTSKPSGCSEDFCWRKPLWGCSQPRNTVSFPAPEVTVTVEKTGKKEEERRVPGKGRNLPGVTQYVGVKVRSKTFISWVQIQYLVHSSSLLHQDSLAADLRQKGTTVSLWKPFWWVVLHLSC